jgi:hypothetical protein
MRLVRHLLDYKADVSIQDKEGKTALSLARHSDCIHILSAAQAALTLSLSDDNEQKQACLSSDYDSRARCPTP